jgi:hypothetical protein
MPSVPGDNRFLRVKRSIAAGESTMQYLWERGVSRDRLERFGSFS